MTPKKLSKKQVLHVAQLSNLKLTKAEIKKFTPQLAKIIDFVGALNEVDTSNTKPTSQTTGLVNVTRVDEVKVENILTLDGYYKVPALLTNRT